MATWVDPMAERLEDHDDDPPPFDGWTVLLAAIDDRRPAWHARAACRYAEGVTWFPEKGQSTEPAKAVCAGCPTAQECERYAIELEARHGVWAGVSVARRGRQQAA